MKFFKPKTIKNEFFLMSILQTSSHIFLVGLISSIITLNILRIRAFDDTMTFFNDISTKFSDFSDNTFDISQNILYDKLLLDSIVTGEDNGEHISNLLKTVLINNNDIQAASLVVNGSEYIASQGKNQLYKYNSIGYNNLKSTVYESDRGFIWHTLYKTKNSSDIFFTRRIVNPYTGNPCGTLSFQFSSRIVSDLLSFVQKSDNRNFCVLSSNKQPIYKGFDPPIDTLDKTNSEDNGIITTFSNYYYFRTLENLDWKMIYCVDKFSLYKILYLLICLILLLCALSIAITVFFTRHINNTVVSPIRDLSQDMQNWNENIVIKEQKKYDISEIDMLYNDFKNMTSKVSDLINKNYKAELIRRESEFKMLQSQINPHFIFNTLEMINSFAVIYDAEEISRITVAFSELIEQNIGYETTSVHTLKEELHLIDCYLTIMRIRFGNRINVTMNIDPSTLGIPTPRLIMQPIVENSISHGIIPSCRKCWLRINTSIYSNNLIVKISDNGVGFEREKLLELQKSFESHQTSIEKSIGLINVNRRITLLYGSDYRLKITSIPDELTEVTIKIAIPPDGRDGM